jgi:hypothetical protein
MVSPVEGEPDMAEFLWYMDCDYKVIILNHIKSYSIILNKAPVFIENNYRYFQNNSKIFTMSVEHCYGIRIRLNSDIFRLIQVRSSGKRFKMILSNLFFYMCF